MQNLLPSHFIIILYFEKMFDMNTLEQKIELESDDCSMECEKMQ